MVGKCQIIYTKKLLLYLADVSLQWLYPHYLFLLFICVYHDTQGKEVY